MKRGREVSVGSRIPTQLPKFSGSRVSQSYPSSPRDDNMALPASLQKDLKSRSYVEQYRLHSMFREGKIPTRRFVQSQSSSIPCPKVRNRLESARKLKRTCNLTKPVTLPKDTSKGTTEVHKTESTFSMVGPAPASALTKSKVDGLDQFSHPNISHDTSQSNCIVDSGVCEIISNYTAVHVPNPALDDEAPKSVKNSASFVVTTAHLPEVRLSPPDGKVDLVIESSRVTEKTPTGTSMTQTDFDDADTACGIHSLPQCDAVSSTAIQPAAESHSALFHQQINQENRESTPPSNSTVSKLDDQEETPSALGSTGPLSSITSELITDVEFPSMQPPPSAKVGTDMKEVSATSLRLVAPLISQVVNETVGVTTEDSGRHGNRKKIELVKQREKRKSFPASKPATFQLGPRNQPRNTIRDADLNASHQKCKADRNVKSKITFEKKSLESEKEPSRNVRSALPTAVDTPKVEDGVGVPGRHEKCVPMIEKVVKKPPCAKAKMNEGSVSRNVGSSDQTAADTSSLKSSKIQRIQANYAPVQSESFELPPDDCLLDPSDDLVHYSRIVLMYKTGEKLTGIIRLTNSCSDGVFFRISACSTVPDRYSIEPKEGKLDPYKKAIVKFFSESVLDESEIMDDTFKIETVKTPATSYTATRRFWMNVNPAKVRTSETSCIMRYHPNHPFFKRCIEHGKCRSNIEEFIRVKEDGTHVSIDLREILEDIEFAQQEIIRLRKLERANYVVASFMVATSFFVVLYFLDTLPFTNFRIPN